MFGGFEELGLGSGVRLEDYLPRWRGLLDNLFRDSWGGNDKGLGDGVSESLVLGLGFLGFEDKLLQSLLGKPEPSLLPLDGPRLLQGFLAGLEDDFGLLGSFLPFPSLPEVPLPLLGEELGAIGEPFNPELVQGPN